MRSTPFAVALTGALFAFSPLQAQRTATVRYPGGGPGINGFSSASVTVQYNFMSCDGGTLWISMGSMPATLNRGSSYWYNGKVYQTPDVNVDYDNLHVQFAGSVIWPTPQGQKRVASVNYNTSPAYSSGCYDAKNFQTLVKLEEILGSSATAAQHSAFVRSLYVEPSMQGQPLKSNAVESRIESQNRAAQAATERAERDRLSQVRSDSIAKAKAAQARLDSLANRRTAAAEQTQRDAVAKAPAAETATAGARSAKPAGTSAPAKPAAKQRADDAAAKQEADNATNDAIASNARLQAQITQNKWDSAERAFNRGDFGTAQPLYMELLNNSVYAPMAQQRLNSIQEKNVEELVKLTAKAGAAVGKVADGVMEEISFMLDDVGVPKYAGQFLSIDGGGTVKGATGPSSSPTGLIFGWGNYRAFVFEARVGYSTLPTMSYVVLNDDSNNREGTLDVRPAGATVGGSFGFSFPFNKYVPYGTIGVDGVLGGLHAEPGQYSIQTQWGGLFSYKATLGLQYRMSDSKGVGLAYTASSVTPYDFSGIGVAGGSVASQSYIVEKPVKTGYSYSSFRVQFFFNLNSPKID